MEDQRLFGDILLLEGLPHPDDPVVRWEKTSIGLGYFSHGSLAWRLLYYSFVMCHDIYVT